MRTALEPVESSSALHNSSKTFSRTAVSELIDLLARLIAQEHHRRTAEKLGKWCPPNGVHTLTYVDNDGSRR